MPLEIPEVARRGRGVITSDTPEELKARLSKALVLPMAVFDRMTPAMIRFLDSVMVTDGPFVAAALLAHEGLGQAVYSRVFPLSDKPKLWALSYKKLPRGFTDDLLFSPGLILKSARLINCVAHREPLKAPWSTWSIQTPVVPVVLGVTVDARHYYLAHTEPMDLTSNWIQTLETAIETFPFLDVYWKDFLG